jgi:hypothetical protein
LNKNRTRAEVASASPYTSAFRTAERFYADEELNASPPTRVACEVEKILKQKRPKVRYIVGSPIERLGVLGKRLLPAAVFELFTRIFYFP